MKYCAECGSFDVARNRRHSWCAECGGEDFKTFFQTSDERNTDMIQQAAELAETCWEYGLTSLARGSEWAVNWGIVGAAYGRLMDRQVKESRRSTPYVLCLTSALACKGRSTHRKVPRDPITPSHVGCTAPVSVCT